MSTTTKRKANVSMSNEPAEVGTEVVEVSDYAPRANRKPYLTDTMIIPASNVNTADPVRLSQITGPAIDQIGKSTAEQLELVAVTTVENARRGAETILGEAQIQATDMIATAERIADEMRQFATALRAYSERKAQQVSSYCAVAESIIGTMATLGDQFQNMTVEEVRIEKEAQENPIKIPGFLRRGKQ